ncbi:MAG: ATP-binding cassette domain-containing protein [Hyphomicrobiaceae bacterium]
MASVAAAIEEKAGPSPAASGDAAAIMRLKGLSRRFGSLMALSDVTFDIKKGEILGIAGPNGAGKTTLLNLCTGALAPSSGQVIVDGEDLAGSRPHVFCRAGVARTFQVPQVFSSMTIRDNVWTGARFGLAGKRGGADPSDAADAALGETGLTRIADEPVARADLLTRKRAMLAAALATGPKLVFMDEPFGGLNAAEVDDFAGLIRKLFQQLRITFVVVEHKIRALSQLSDRMLILNFGRVLSLDTPERVLNDEEVIRIYLGKRNLA